MVAQLVTPAQHQEVPAPRVTSGRVPLARSAARAPGTVAGRSGDALDAAFRSIAAAAAPPALPGIDDVRLAALRLSQSLDATTSQNDWQMHSATRGAYALVEGRTLRLEVSPGTVAAVLVDENRGDQRHARAAAARLAGVDAMAQFVQQDDNGDWSVVVPEGLGGAEVTEWSAKSRARMFRTISQLDLSCWMDAAPGAGDLGMLTLTLPGWWEIVAPDGATFKRLVRNFQHRARRAGIEWVCLWKLEFQERGAPHYHMLMRLPVFVWTDGGYGKRLGYEVAVPFKEWVSRTWADVCLDSLSERDALAYIDLGEYDRHVSAGTAIDFDQRKMSDPRRIAIYFLGHSAKHTDGKEYQHRVPSLWQAEGRGPGRFWGYCGLDKAVVSIDVDPADYDLARRVLRRVARARAAKHRADAERFGKTVTYRPLRSLGARGGLNGGTVVVNDGPALALALARALPMMRAAKIDRSHEVWWERRGAIPPNHMTPAWQSAVYARAALTTGVARDLYGV